MVRLARDRPEQVLAFVREPGEDRVLALLSFSDETAAALSGSDTMSIEPRAYRALYRGARLPREA